MSQPSAAAPHIPGFAWAYTVTFDGDTHWLECDFCSEPVKPVEAGDSLEDIVTRARDHERGCATARPTQETQP